MQGKVSVRRLVTIWCTSSSRCHKQWKYRVQKPQWTRIGRSSRQFQRGVWKKLRARRRLILEAPRDKKKAHFSSLMDLCHLKKCRVWTKKSSQIVLRTDIVTDDSVLYWTKFVCEMTAARVMDVIARRPDCDGQAADAVSAYTQVEMEDAPKLLKIPKSECPEIWIRLPRHKWPKSWSSIEDPVVPLERNLYGHLLAGLFWERQFEKVLLKHGWEKIPNWEYLFVHSEKGLF